MKCAHGVDIFDPEPCARCAGNEAPPVTAAVTLDNDLNIPEFLDRKQHPELIPEPMSPGAYSAGSKNRQQADFRERFPLTERDKVAIEQLQREQLVAKRDRTANRLRKAGFTK